ncbi:MAG TPA: hypothetical protein VML00_11645 [Bacteroidota bacterium]|nr:hypothetical protein [Bacteroidota bacterium]
MRTIWICALALLCAAPSLAAGDSTRVPARAAVDTARMSARHRTARPGESKKRKAPPIDVRALAALQAAQESPASAATTPARSGSALPLLGVSLLIAGGSTGVILWILARVQRRQRRPARASVRADGRLPGDAPAGPPHDPAGDRSAPAVVDAVDEEEDDPFYGVGKEMRGAREEFALAMRMQSTPLGDSLRRGAVEACGEHASLAERVKIARRLGVGRGEIDLALRLQKLETIVPAEEEPV